MSLPDETRASVIHPNTFNYSHRRRGHLEDFEMGGIALSDSSHGNLYQMWRIMLDGDDVVAEDETGHRELFFARTGITELALAFDQNMNPFVAFLENNQPRFWWYDTIAGTQVFSDLPADAYSLCATLDDKRAASSGDNDILLCYLRGRDLYYRRQRDRYDTEILWAADVGAALHAVSMNEGFRLQFVVSRGD